MEIKNITLINSASFLKELLDYPDIPIKTSFKLIKNAKKIEVALEAYNEANNKLLEKYGEKKEDGTLDISPDGQINILSENVFNYTKDRKELLDSVNQLDIDIIDIEELSVERIKPAILLSLDYMFKIT